MSEEDMHGDEAPRLISRQLEKLENHYPGHGAGCLELFHKVDNGVIHIEVFFRATARHERTTMAVAHGGSRDEVFYVLARSLYMRETRFKIEERDEDDDFKMCKRRWAFVSRPSPLRQAWTA